MIFLDTHAWLWWVDAPERLSSRARAAIEEVGSPRLSAISCWELSLLAVRGRIRFDRPTGEWIRSSLRTHRLEVVPLDADTAIAAAMLPRTDFPSDPADRFIYATARMGGGPLITRDERLRAYDPDGTVW